MTQHLKPADLAAQVRMERQRGKRSYLLVEGSTDIKRLKRFFVPSAVSFINCFGKDNVIGAVDIEQNAGRQDILGFVDADFDRVSHRQIANDDIVVSKCHDFDLDACSTSAMERYLDEMADAAKVAAAGGWHQCAPAIMHAIKPLSALRFANERHNLRYKLSDLDLSLFFDGYTVDVNALVDQVSGGKFSSAEDRANLISRINQYAGSEHDLWQFTNGHDLMSALGIALRGRLGTRKMPQTWRAEIERHFRLAFDGENLMEAGHVAKIRTWEQSRGLPAILKNSCS